MTGQQPFLVSLTDQPAEALLFARIFRGSTFDSVNILHFVSLFSFPSFLFPNSFLNLCFWFFLLSSHASLSWLSQRRSAFAHVAAALVAVSPPSTSGQLPVPRGLWKLKGPWACWLRPARQRPLLSRPTCMASPAQSRAIALSVTLWLSCLVTCVLLISVVAEAW